MFTDMDTDIVMQACKNGGVSGSCALSILSVQEDSDDY